MPSPTILAPAAAMESFPPAAFALAVPFGAAFGGTGAAFEAAFPTAAGELALCVLPERSNKQAHPRLSAQHRRGPPAHGARPAVHGQASQPAHGGGAHLLRGARLARDGTAGGGERGFADGLLARCADHALDMELPQGAIHHAPFDGLTATNAPLSMLLGVARLAEDRSLVRVPRDALQRLGARLAIEAILVHFASQLLDLHDGTSLDLLVAHQAATELPLRGHALLGLLLAGDMHRAAGPPVIGRGAVRRPPRGELHGGHGAEGGMRPVGDAHNLPNGVAYAQSVPTTCHAVVDDQVQHHGACIRLRGAIPQALPGTSEPAIP
mmetsp:Transcript_93453/g.302612  ORF Transcript_93453/g.302612 Transcript_93453/m.302612 type:complete len:324 (-) Transcript_93453:420-1391(-)